MVVRGEHFICSPTEINALILARFIHSSQPPRWPGGSRARLTDASERRGAPPHDAVSMPAGCVYLATGAGL